VLGKSASKENAQAAKDSYLNEHFQAFTDSIKMINSYKKKRKPFENRCFSLFNLVGVDCSPALYNAIFQRLILKE
jgi:hypothetical protein